MCNDNNVAFTPRTDPADAHYIRFSHDRNLSADTEINPSNWFNNVPANSCRKHTEIRTINPCSSNYRGLSIAMDGNLQVGRPNYCRCFLREWIRSVKENKDPLTPSPRPPTTPPPTPPTPPTTPPPVNPPPPDCDFHNVIITELASPADTFAKYIELLFLDEGCKGQVIDVNLYVGRYIDGDCDYDEDPNNYINLSGEKVGDEGFFSICNHETAEFVYGRGKCALIGGLQSVANLRGIDTIALGKEEGADIITIDIFGVPCQSCADTNSCIKNGRAVRKINVWTPQPVFYETSWQIFPGNCNQEVGPEAMDINEWKDTQGPICPPETTIIITEIVDLPGDESLLRPPRFVELHAPRLRHRGRGFRHDLKLVIFHGDSPEPNWSSAIDIEYMPENGFLVVCNRAAADLYGDECAVTSMYLGGPADSNGYDQIALISGDEDSWFVVDIYGVIGEDGWDTDHDFQDSRIIRNLSVTNSSAIWSKDDWLVCNAKPDPNAWNNDCVGGDDDWTPSTNSPTTDEQGNCKFFLTELADSEGSPYIEIKSTCPGITISRDLIIHAYKPYGASCELNLKGVQVSDDGFIIICKNKIQHHLIYGGNPIFVAGSWHDLSVCDIEDSNLLTGFGFNSYVLKDHDSECQKSCEGSNCSVGCSDVYMDIYGYIGTSLEGSPHEYLGCRAVRNIRYPYGIFPFQPTIWETICNMVGDDGSDLTGDPRQWDSSSPKLVISELCDPVDNKNKRQISIYAYNKRNYVINEDIILMRWVGSSPYPSYTFQSLKGETIDEGGFLKICLPVHTWYGELTCNLMTPYSGIVGSMHGVEHYAIAECKSPSFGCKIMDIYGEPGTAAVNSEQDFSDGRAVRQLYMSKPTDRFNMYEWVVETPVTFDVCGTDPYYKDDNDNALVSKGKGKGYRNYAPSKRYNRKN
jgi:hypothetical protein